MDTQEILNRANKYAAYVTKTRKYSTTEKNQMWPDLVQQACLLMLMGNSDKRVKLRLSRYVEFLCWRYGSRARGTRTSVILCPTFYAVTSKGYRPFGHGADLQGKYVGPADWRDEPGVLRNYMKAKVDKKLCRCGKLAQPGYKTCKKCYKRSRGAKFRDEHKN